MPSEKWLPVGERLAGVAGKFLPPKRTTLIQNCGTSIRPCLRRKIGNSRQASVPPSPGYSDKSCFSSESSKGDLGDAETAVFSGELRYELIASCSRRPSFEVSVQTWTK
jgi:hypothetical protein